MSSGSISLVHCGLTSAKVNGVVGGIIGTVTTILRLILRRRRLWWDDACAFLSMLNLVLHVASIFVDIDGISRISI